MSTADKVPKHRGTGKSEVINIFDNPDYIVPPEYAYKGQHVAEPEPPAPKPVKARGAYVLSRFIHPPIIPRP